MIKIRKSKAWLRGKDWGYKAWEVKINIPSLRWFAAASESWFKSVATYRDTVTMVEPYWTGKQWIDLGDVPF